MEIGSTNSSGATHSEPQVNRFAEIDSTEFLNIMLSELTNQDPLEPQDTAAMMEQLSSLRNIEAQYSLQESLENLVLQNQVASAGALIGRMVRGMDDQNNQVEGLVQSVAVRDGVPYLKLDTSDEVAMKRVTDIAEPPQPPQTEQQQQALYEQMLAQQASLGAG